MSKNYFRDLDRDEEDGHPVDLLVAKRLRHKRAAYSRAARTMAKKITSALGAKAKLFAEYDSICCDWNAAREEAFFNVGYEQGLAAGRLQALGSIRSTSDKQTALMVLLQQRMNEANIASREGAQVLLEMAWALLCRLEANDE